MDGRSTNGAGRAVMATLKSSARAIAGVSSLAQLHEAGRHVAVRRLAALKLRREGDSCRLGDRCERLERLERDAGMETEEREAQRPRHRDLWAQELDRVSRRHRAAGTAEEVGVRASAAGRAELVDGPSERGHLVARERREAPPRLEADQLEAGAGARARRRGAGALRA
jgi:hypothetical protein